MLAGFGRRHSQFTWRAGKAGSRSGMMQPAKRLVDVAFVELRVRPGLLI